MDKFLQLYKDKFSDAGLTPVVVLGGLVLGLTVGLKALLIVAAFALLIALEDKYLLN